MKMHSRLAVILALGIRFAASGQQSAPPQPPNNAQQLAADMQVIQKELNAVGKLSFVVHVSNADEKGTSKVIEENSKVVADAASCTIRYHWWRSMHGEVVNDEDDSMNLREAQGVWVMSSDEYYKKVTEKEGPTPDGDRGYYMRYTPPLFMVFIRMVNDDEEGFPFTDETQAGRVGKAFPEAVKLCSGKLGAY